MTRRLVVVIFLMLALAAWGFAAQPAMFKVMTQNMDAGTDLGFAIGGLLQNNAVAGVELTYQEVLGSKIPDRAALLAKQIANRKPELLALQEATLWRTGDSVATATTLLYDQLELLLSDLKADGVPYNVVAVNTLGDLALPKESGALRFTDRDALLIRADLGPPELHFSDVHSMVFNATYGIGGLQVPAGWISAMIHLGNRHFRLITTHLQSPVVFDPTAAEIQTEQAQQLLWEIRNSTVPVVLAGDFNSDAIQGNKGNGPDNTGTAAMIEAAGYTDTWKVAGTGPGPTWPLYLEDQLPLFFARAFPFERIDLIFSQGLNVVSVEHVFAPGPNAVSWPYYGSDHAGVVAALTF
jgi:endonuclease/exonuclease/phosphatase family metal-dependent hydrolase